MTIKGIYVRALAKVFEQQGGDPDFDQYSPLLLDGLLVEALPYENQIRRQKGLPLVDRAPEIIAIDDTEIDWDDRITRIALPYGLASVLLGDDESRKAESVIARNEFVQALEEAAPAVFEAVDAFGSRMEE